MVGLADAKEAALLDSSALFGQTLYLRLLQGSVAGTTVNDNGTLPSGVTEVSTGGYTPRQVLSTAWGAAAGGSPSTKRLPAVGGTAITFTPTGGATWTLCGYCWTTDSGTIAAGNLVSSGVMIDQTLAVALRTVNAANPFSVADATPLIERLGDPPAGTNPT